MLKKLRSLITNRGVMSDIFLSHILVLVIPIVINIVIEGFIIRSVRSETEQAGSLVVENVRSNMDNMIDNVERITKQINSNDGMLPIYQYKVNRDNYGLKNSINILKYTCQNTNDIEDIFVYNKDSDLIVTTAGRGLSETFVRTYYEGTDVDYQRWTEDMDALKDKMFRVVYKQNSAEVAYLEYLCPLTGNYIESYNHADANFPAIMTIRMNFSELALSEAVEENYKGVSFYIVTPEGKVISKDDTSLHDGEYILSQYSGEGFGIFEKKGIMYICKRSEKNGWIYVSSAPIWKYNKASVVAIIAVVLGSVIILLLGLKLIARFIKTNYGGIINLGDRIMHELHMWENVKINDINKCFEEIFDERNVLSKRIEHMSEVQYSTCVLRLLEGVPVKNDNEEFEKIKEHMDSDAFCVVCCQIEDCTELYSESEYEKISDEEKEQDAFFIVKNVLSELLESNSAVIGVPIRNQIVFLVGNKGENAVSFERGIVGIVKNFAESAAENFMIRCVVSIGPTIHSYQAISQSYFAAVGGLSYAFVLKRSRVILAKDYSDRNDRYEITPYQRQQLSVNISSGNTNGAIDVLNELYDENIDCRSLSMEMIKCFLMELSGIYEEIISENTTLNQQNLTVTVFGFKRIEQTRAFFEELTVNICDEVNQNKVDKYEELVEKINQYIDSCYMDNNINVFAIASMLGMSRAYVSKIFKQHMGDSILNTIHKKRIDKAVELLAEGKSVSEIAEKVGYVNSNVFIRTFKKLKGVTPSRYESNS